MEKDELQAERVRAAVFEILAVADMGKITTRGVRDLAAEKTGVDLSGNREWRDFVTNLIMNYFKSSSAEKENSKPSPDPKKPRIGEAFRDSSSEGKPEEVEKTKEMEDMKKEEDVSEQEYEDDGDDEDEARGEGRRAKYEVDKDGNHTICTWLVNVIRGYRSKNEVVLQLSGQRKVVVSKWKGKTLISIRGYYEKDGQTLPSATGISLTAEQFEILASVANDIDRAISSIQ